MQNLITRANFATRQALQYEADFNKSLGESPSHRLDSTGRRIANAGDQLVKGLLFADEAKLTGPIVGTSDFAKGFSQTGPRDRQGRSLRDLDLTTRLFKYPCSYLIYSTAFDGLPCEMKSYVSQRLQSVLTEVADNDPGKAKQDALDFAPSLGRRSTINLANTERDEARTF